MISESTHVKNGELTTGANHFGLLPLFCEASPKYTSYTYESEEERANRLGIDKDYKWSADLSNYEGISDGIVSVSYKTILIYIAYALAVVGVVWLLWYLYKRIK